MTLIQPAKQSCCIDNSMRRRVPEQHAAVRATLLFTKSYLSGKAS
jgi:hypothetical protein